jgi:hypothetical protein
MPAHPASGPWVYLIPLLAVAMVVLRNARARKLSIERLWVAPLMVLVLTGLVFAAQPAPSPALLAVDLAVLAAGALAGWWRGRLTRIAVDQRTRALTSRTSPVGMLLILGVFAMRYGVRSYGAETASALHVPALQVTDALMLFAVGLVCAQRLEIALRATRLLAEANGR